MQTVPRPESPALGRGGDPPRCALDQRNKDGSPAVRKTLSSVLSSLNRPAQGADVTAALDMCLKLPDAIGCLNPLCENTCAWPTGRGRPRDYCSRGCRQSALRTNTRLVGELALLERALAAGGLRKVDRVRLEARAAQTRWCLRRYPAASQQNPATFDPEHDFE
jgi:hypothetical protein